MLLGHLQHHTGRTHDGYGQDPDYHDDQRRRGNGELLLERVDDASEPAGLKKKVLFGSSLSVLHFSSNNTAKTQNLAASFIWFLEQMLK